MQMSDVTEPVLTETELEELKGRVAEGDTEAMVDLGMHYWDEGSDLKKAATLLRQAAMAGDDVAMGQPSTLRVTTRYPQAMTAG